MLFGNAINKPRRWSTAKVCVNGDKFCKPLLQKHQTVPFTGVNVTALPGGHVFSTNQNNLDNFRNWSPKDHLYQIILKSDINIF